MSQPFDLFVEIVSGLQVGGLAELDQLIPPFVEIENLEEPHPTVLRAPISLEGVVFRMTGKLDHVAGQPDGIVDTPHVNQVPDQPLVVVGKVVNLVGQHPVTNHVRMIDTGRSFLLETGILISLQS